MNLTYAAFVAAQAATPVAFAASDETPAERHFIDKVKPLLDSRCIRCHGADKVKGAFRLDSRATTLKGGENGRTVIPGKPADSLLLYKRV